MEKKFVISKIHKRYLKMIKKLMIDNFRSIDHLEFEPKRINVIIGEEGTGKSTLLEALGMVSFLGVYNLIEISGTKFYLDQLQNFSLQHFVKYSNLHAGDLLHKFDETEGKKNYAEVILYASKFNSNMELKINIRLKNYLDGCNVESLYENYDNYVEQRRIRYYNFNGIPLINCNFAEYLLPSFGMNFWSLVENDKDIIEKIKGGLDAYGIGFGFDTSKDCIPSIKPACSDNWIPISNLSDAIQLEFMYRLTHWKDADDASLIYPGFGQGMFVGQTKSLCENMALMEKTQFFITTYDENVVMWLLEKTPKEQIGLYATYMQEGKTKLYEFTEGQISYLMSCNIMFNFQKYLPNY